MSRTTGVALIALIAVLAATLLLLIVERVPTSDPEPVLTELTGVNFGPSRLTERLRTL